jgi:hypothetical protein
MAADWRAFWRGALARALLTATGLAATPAVAAGCAAMTVRELAERLPGAARHEASAELLPPLLLVWRRHRGEALPARPSGVAVFAEPGHPLLLAFRDGDCLLGLLPALPDEVWRTLREQVGPIA